MKSRLPSSKAPPCCPHCGVPMHLRNGYYGYFWGCPNYPRCPFTLNYPSGKLSASQQNFLTGLRDIENLCKSYSSKLAKESDTATIQSLLLSFEDEFSISKKSACLLSSKTKIFLHERIYQHISWISILFRSKSLMLHRRVYGSIEN